MLHDQSINKKYCTENTTSGAANYIYKVRCEEDLGLDTEMSECIIKR